MNTMVESAVQTANEMQSQLIARASEDAAFRAQLIADPKATVQQEFGVEMPDYINIQVHQSELNDVHLVLPPDLEAGMELDEDLLEAISAGLCSCL